ncbi:MAG: transposase [bacterium]
MEKKVGWRDYNESLVKRGEILISPRALRDWKKELRRMNKGKKGRPFSYPNSSMRFFGIIRVVFRLPYRQLEGIARAIM